MHQKWAGDHQGRLTPQFFAIPSHPSIEQSAHYIALDDVNSSSILTIPDDVSDAGASLDFCRDICEVLLLRYRKYADDLQRLDATSWSPAQAQLSECIHILVFSLHHAHTLLFVACIAHFFAFSSPYPFSK